MTTPRLSKLSRSIKGSVALITGAGSGMGEATARLFADEGARLALLDINAGALQRVVADIEATGCEVWSLAIDLADRKAVTDAVVSAAEHFSALDILINNAGLSLLAAVDGDEYEQSWDTSLAVMTTAQAWAIRAALPWLRRAEYPRVVNVASTEAFGATRYNGPYVVAKHAAVGLTRAMAMDLGKEGITVNCVCPGPVNTGITAAISDADKETFAHRRTALRRYGEPEEVAQVTLNTVLPASGFMTGAVLVVDGGLTIRNA